MDSVCDGDWSLTECEKSIRAKLSLCKPAM
jgi:hypothetical protein